ncbi:MAG TPA: DNA translocase FtsK [Candidatus Omnitrophota bacterium]|nr:DNA translocase FtsK [Candidatus Omnitrophota bacterium]HPS36244.1 DNA translocase FtsK [Candidatus Omnitrophota bacterium]
MKKERINEIWGVFFLVLGLIAFASLFFYRAEDISFYTSQPSFPVQNCMGVIGAYVAFGLFMVFGVSAFVIPMVFLLWSWCFFLQNVPERKLFKFIGLSITLLALATIVTISVKPQFRFIYGGAFGYVAGNYLLRYFGQLGSYFIAGGAFLFAFLLATDFLLYPMFRAMTKKIRGGVEGITENLEKAQKGAEKFAAAARKAQVQAEREAKQREKEERQREKERQRLEKEKEKAASRMPEEIAKLETKIKTYEYKPQPPQAKAEIDRKAEALKKEEMKAKNPKQVETPKTPSSKEAGSESQASETTFTGIIGAPVDADQGYEFPSPDLLRKPVNEKVGGDDLAANSKIIEETLAEFGLEVKVVEVEQGPVITRYELLPAPGVKVNLIESYSNDLALALKATSIRFIIPIPGKSAVGVEVPNSVSRAIYMREMVECPEFQSKKYILPLALGKDTSGKSLIAELAAMPHILIAGTTGSGKTVCINSIIAGLLYYCKPSQLKFVMIDPKMVELAIYNKIPHMLSPVVTDVRKAANTLNWVVMEMERRYRLFAAVGVRDIQAFNSRELSEEDKAQLAQVKDSENVIPAAIPRIVVIVDELADMMMVAQDKVETAIIRLAQLSRAVGIHLILATQRPSVDVITGIIKANMPARVAFKVNSAIDSRTILDGKGAEKLVGRGDMLFIQPGTDKMVRGQASFIITEEINRLVAFVSKQGRPEYHSEIQAAQNGTANGAGSSNERDELFEEAKNIVLTSRQASTSYLQRRLGLGYTRAARIIDQLEASGAIGPQQGAKPREILLPNPNGDYSEATPVESEEETS